MGCRQGCTGKTEGPCFPALSDYGLWSYGRRWFNETQEVSRGLRTEQKEIERNEQCRAEGCGGGCSVSRAGSQEYITYEMALHSVLSVPRMDAARFRDLSCLSSSFKISFPSLPYSFISFLSLSFLTFVFILFPSPPFLPPLHLPLSLLFSFVAAVSAG